MQSSKDYLTVFTPFLELLRSPSPITLSQETLLGAITHFLSTLPSHDLISFTSTLVESPSLWKSDTRRQEELRHAIRLGVPAKVNGANHELRNSYFLRIKQQRSARRWLSDVSKAMMTSKASTGRNVALVGLLEGLSDVSNVDWGRSRVRVEEEIILGLSSIQSDQDEKTQQELKLVCASILYIAEERVRVLDLKTILPCIQVALFQSFEPTSEASPSTPPGPETSSETAANFSRALSRAITVLDHGGPSSQQFAWNGVKDFCAQMRAAVTNFETKNVSVEDWHRQKIMLFAFLHPASSILQILLLNDRVSQSDTRDMTIEILFTLAAFVEVVDGSQGGIEGYDKVLYGCIDVLVARGGSSDVKRLFDLFFEGAEMTDAKSTFVLLVAEQLVHYLEEITVGHVLSICERHIHRPQHRRSFEATHSLLLALIVSASRSLATEGVSYQGDFLEEMLLYYPDILLKQTRDGDISNAELRQAYSLIVSAASRHTPFSVYRCVHLLDVHESSTKDTDWSQTFRLIRISIVPFIPHSALPAYLDDLVRRITELDTNLPQRQELSALAFKVVVEDLPDVSKRLGIEWWLEWRDRFEGRIGLSTELKARL